MQHDQMAKMFSRDVGNPGPCPQSDLRRTGILKLCFPFLDACPDHSLFGYFNMWENTFPSLIFSVIFCPDILLTPCVAYRSYGIRKNTFYTYVHIAEASFSFADHEILISAGFMIHTWCKGVLCCCRWIMEYGSRSRYKLKSKLQ